MKMQFSSRYWMLSIAILLVSAIALAWAGNPQNPSTGEMQIRDTVPGKKPNAGQPGDKDLDKELLALEEARERLKEIKEKDWNKIQHEVAEAMKKIDMEKIRLQAEEAIRKVDMEKIGREIEETIQKIDFKKIEQDVETAMNELSKIDKEKVSNDIRKAGKELQEVLEKKEWRKEKEEIRKIDFNQVREEMEKAKLEISRAADQVKLEKFNMQETMDKARLEIDKAKEELKGYQEMIYGLEQDGLLNTKEDYSIEYKQGELSINGKLQSPEVTNKYKKYFKKDSMKIRKLKGDIKIDSPQNSID